VLAHALGGKTFKLKFGHRGGNHPVKELSSGLVRITAQNHGYAVDPDSLPQDVTVSHVNLNDGTVEGLKHKSLPLFTIQYHSEASPGPLDNVEMFDRFLALMREHTGAFRGKR
jgi:carbamoyl-phosphate synthase small subunit